MSLIRSMYARVQSPAAVKDKNPNRVLGGLKGHGADHYSMLGEDGTEREVPTRSYVQGLEDKMRKLEERINVQERQIKKLRNL
tara:strand:- start:241 stop:489 length:249 start_codon:yes stop_codon:yes gene_type:complete